MYLNPKFHNFSPTQLIVINVFSQHRNCKTKESYTRIKNRIENFKNTMELSGN